MTRIHKIPPSVRTVLRGFETVSRFWDAPSGIWVAQVLPGEFYVSNQDEIITTVLGSCVSTCIRDDVAGVGGINHFMLANDTGREGGESLRYGLFAIERLINEVLKHGGNRERLEVKVFGGARVIPGMGDIGRANVEFVRKYLAQEGMTSVAEDVGMNFARRLRYHPLTGQAMVKQLPVNEVKTVVESEKAHEQWVRGKVRAKADVELF